MAPLGLSTRHEAQRPPLPQAAPRPLWQISPCPAPQQRDPRSAGNWPREARRAAGGALASAPRQQKVARQPLWTPALSDGPADRRGLPAPRKAPSPQPSTPVFLLYFT